jgi:hypothetical protein
MHPLHDPRSLLPSVAWRSSIKLTPSPSKSGDRAEGARRGARYWIVERAEGRVVSAYWTKVTPEGATSRKRGAESAAGRKLAKCEHRHPWWHLASARTERRAARVKRSAASASMNSHGRENRAGATSLEACVSTQWSSMRHMRGTFRCRRRLLRVERGY